MKKVLILLNHVNGFYSHRAELVERINEDYKVIVSMPKCEESPKLKYYKDIGIDFKFLNLQKRGKNPFKDLALLIKYYNLIKEINPDIVLTYTIRPNVYGTYVASIINKPVIMNITGLGSAFYNPVFKSIAVSFYKIACNKAKCIFFQNKQNLSFFLSNNVVDKSKVQLIPGSGVNIDKFVPLEKEKADSVIRFLYMGRVMEEKGIEEYLEVAKRIKEKYSNVEFQILGNYEEPRYEEIVENSKYAVYLGMSNDVRNEVKEVDCIVSPSYHEGMSNVLLEGAAMGKPLIASNISGCKEIIDDGSNGYLFEVKSVDELEEKIIQFIELDNEKKKLMGKNSRKKVKKQFDRNIVIDEYIKAINSVLKEGYKNESRFI